MDLDRARNVIKQGNYSISTHAITEARKDGISLKTAEKLELVVLNGWVIEDYPERHRCLIGYELEIEGMELPIHVVLEHEFSYEPAIVTAYVPDSEVWIRNKQRRPRRKSRSKKKTRKGKSRCYPKCALALSARE